MQNTAREGQHTIYEKGKCPHCGLSNITRGNLTVDGGVIFYPVLCNDCLMPSQERYNVVYEMTTGNLTHKPIPSKDQIQQYFQREKEEGNLSMDCDPTEVVEEAFNDILTVSLRCGFPDDEAKLNICEIIAPTLNFSLDTLLAIWEESLIEFFLYIPEDDSMPIKVINSRQNPDFSGIVEGPYYSKRQIIDRLNLLHITNDRRPDDFHDPYF